MIAVHGGAGDGIARLPRDRLEAPRRALEGALDAGADVLRRQGSALDAVIAAAKILEDHPEFNAGRGAVPTITGTVEHDAAVADGHLRRAGAVAACPNLRNPVEAARAVMEKTDHVLLVGEAVAALAERWKLEMETPQAGGRGRLPSGGDTVGAVARDVDGHLAAATSTGGRAGQLPGRVGDSPVVGAGIWADDATCAVSATGHGEKFLLAAFAHEVDALMRLSGVGLYDACERALEAVSARDGKGGCIAVDTDGNLAMPFTAAAMFRGWKDSSGAARTAVLRDD